MERYLGLDVHAESCTFSVLSESGKEIRRDVVETNGKALVGFLKQLPGQPGRRRPFWRRSRFCPADSCDLS
jgi:hypothetical protein